MKKLLFLSLFIMFAVNVFAQEVPFTLEVTNVRSDKGNIMVGICSTEDQFLEKDKCTYAFSMPAAKGTMVKNLNIVKGKYAIIIYHDENNDGGWAASATGHLASNGYTEWSGNHSHNVGVGNTGSNQAHQNMPPYISCYMWKRTQ